MPTMIINLISIFNMKRISPITSALIPVVLIAKVIFPSQVLAEQYGQGGVVLGDESADIVHASVNAGFAENIAIVSLFLIALSAGFVIFQHKLNKYLQM